MPPRPRHEMPDYFRNALNASGLMNAYLARPPYQQNDYIGWITRAKLETTKQKRLSQMLDELKRGGVYMKMKWNGWSRNTAQNEIIQKTADFIKQEFSDDTSGHDWWHIHRVWKNAISICEREQADLYIVELAALLHDLDDWKFNESEDETPLRAKAWMEACDVDPQVNQAVCQIIMNVSYKGAQVENKMKSLEGFIVQDADRLDAIGAVGIGRAFAYGGYKNRPLYDPDVENNMHASFEQYKNSKSATINHFYEKLLLLKDMMNTATARKIAEGRHQVMLRFLDQFMMEWDGLDLE
jgi:uncharacterized protein